MKQEKYQLDVHFVDGQVHTEKFFTELGCSRAERWWRECAPQGIESFRVTILDGAK